LCRYAEVLEPIKVKRLNSEEVLSMVMHYEFSKVGLCSR
jgi:hypothetical protein